MPVRLAMIVFPKCLDVSLDLPQVGGCLLVDETSGAELGLETAKAKDFGETPLMVVVSVFLRRVDSSNVDDNVQRLHYAVS
jgi:hypothetical protein